MVAKPTVVNSLRMLIIWFRLIEAGPSNEPSTEGMM